MPTASLAYPCPPFPYHYPPSSLAQSPVSRDAGEEDRARRLRRLPGAGHYHLEAAWAYLCKHAPQVRHCTTVVVWNRTSTRALHFWADRDTL